MHKHEGLFTWAKVGGKLKRIDFQERGGLVDPLLEAAWTAPGGPRPEGSGLGLPNGFWTGLRS